MAKAGLGITDRAGVRGRFRGVLRRVSRWYAITCARDDAVRVGFVVVDHLGIDTYHS